MNFYKLDQIILENKPADAINQFMAQINAAIDEWEKETKNNIINSVQNAPKRGLLSRMGGAIQNMFYGRRNQDNPQYWKNQFGDSLGMKEDFDPLLAEIMSLAEETENLVKEAILLEWPSGGTMGKKFQQTKNSQDRMGMSGTMGNQAQKTANAQQSQNQSQPNLKIFNIISSAANNLRQRYKT